jgi:hypothetical protein
VNQPWLREELGIDPIFFDKNISFATVSWPVYFGFMAHYDEMYTTEKHIEALLERGIKVFPRIASPFPITIHLHCT